MSKMIDVLGSGFRALFGYESNYRTIEETIDEEIRKRTGKEIFSCSKTGRVYGTVKLIEMTKKSLIINVNHRDFYELEVMNDSYIYSALYDATHRGVNIDIVLTGEAHKRLSKDILGIAEPFIANTSDFPSSMVVDGRGRKKVYSEDGRTLFWFCGL